MRIIESAYSLPSSERFIEDINMFSYVCHGRVLEADHHELFYSKIHKIINSLVRGEPYQFAHQSVEYRIRVGNLSLGRSTEYKDYSLFGNYLGMIKPGDELKLRIRKGNESVSAIYNCTTERELRPSPQLSAAAVRMISLLVIALIAGAIAGIGYLISSGILVNMFWRVVWLLVELGIVLWIFDMLLFRFFRKKRS